MNKLNLDSLGVQEIDKNEIKNIEGGIKINLFGIYIIEGVLDGVKHNTRGHWSWKK